jgi:branched-chain amino acid transport system substrate-binding protein
VQSVFIIESKTAPKDNPSDVFNVIATDEPNEANLRSCESLGHKA